MRVLAQQEWSTGAAVVANVLEHPVLEHLERDVDLIIQHLDRGYEPPVTSGSLTSGTQQR